MYKLLLILHYLRRKLAPMFAALAVTLCTLMVIVVISVMGGFLSLMRTSVKQLSSDVIVRSDLGGFPHYEALMGRIEGLPEVRAVTPVIHGFGLVKLRGDVHTIEVMGVEPGSLDEVIGFRDSLYWDERAIGERYADTPPGGREFAMKFQPPDEWQLDPERALRGAVPGIEVSPLNHRREDGSYDVWSSSLRDELVVTVVPISRQGAVIPEPSVRKFVVVNEFKSGLYEIDANRVYVPFDVMQEMMKMQAAPLVDPETGEPSGEVDPARVSQLLVRAEEGVPLAQALAAVQLTTQQFINSSEAPMPPMWVMTWEQKHATLLNAVQNEKGLITFLFAIISLVAFVMVATTFYNIVLEKTRDIGTLRALGASRWGVANVFLGYGLAIGIVGALLGGAGAVAIVFNLNEINDLLHNWFGRAMWNPKTYYFDRVPEQVNPVEITWILTGAVLSSVLGALIPAVVAARLNPVESLRYE